MTRLLLAAMLTILVLVLLAVVGQTESQDFRPYLHQPPDETNSQLTLNDSSDSQMPVDLSSVSSSDSPHGLDDPGFSRFWSPFSDFSASSSATSNDLSSPQFQNLSSFSTIQQRVQRAADANAEEFARQVSVLARVANAIALQSGLLNGTIPIDAVVGELLNFGSVPMSDIVDIDPKVVTGALAKVKAAKPVLSGKVSNTNTLRKTIMKWNELRKVSHSLKTVDLTSILKKIKGFDVKFESTELIPLLLTPSNIINRLNSLRQLELDESDQDSATDEYKDLIQQIGKMKVAFKSVQDIRSKMIPISEIEADMSTLRSAKLFMTLADWRVHANPNIKPPDEMVPLYKDFDQLVSSLQQLVVDLTATKKQVNAVLGLVHWRQVPQKSKRDFTSGFSDGVIGVKTLKKEIHEPWLLKIATNNGSAQKLENVLQPLFSASEKISELDAQLKDYLTTEILNSMKRMKSLFDQIWKVPPKLENAERILADYVDCNSKTNYTDKSHFADLDSKVHRIIGFYNKLADLHSLEIVNKDFEWYVKEMDEFMTFIEMSKDEDVTWEKVSAKHKMITTSSQIEHLLSSTSKAKDAGNGRSYSYFDGSKEIVSEEKDTKKLFKTDLVEKELKVFECLKSLGDKSVGVFEVFDPLTGSDQKSIDAMETLVNTLTPVFNEMKSTNTILDIVKKQAKANADKLITMPDSLSISKTLGLSAQFLRNAQSIVGLKPKILFLENIKTAVNFKIMENNDFKVFITASENWGDHDEDMKRLNAFIQSLEPFTNIKSKVVKLGDYGKLFESLKSIGDAKFDAMKKSEALGSLIDDGKDVDNLQMIQGKKTLDEISLLDLQFSKYSKLSGSAPGAFKALDEFLTDFLRVESNGNDGSKSEKSNLILIILCSVLGALLVISAIVMFVLWKKKLLCFKRKIQQKAIVVDVLPLLTKEELHFYMGTYKFRRPIDAYVEHAAILKMIIAEEAKTHFTKYVMDMDQKKYRDPSIKLLHEQCIQAVEYHGNAILTRRGMEFQALQGPLSKDKDHVSTVNDFLTLVCKDNLKHLVMLCRFEELGPDGQSREVCARYFNDIRDNGGIYEIGDWTIYTIVEEYLDELRNSRRDRDVTHRRLNIVHKKRKFPTMTVEHYQFNIWDEGSFPLHGHEACFSIMVRLQDTTDAIGVHCSTGTNRTMMFIGMEYITRQAEVNGKLTWAQAMFQLSQLRYGMRLSIRQSYWMQVGVIYYLGQYFECAQTYQLHLNAFRRLANDFATDPLIPTSHDIRF